MRILTLAFAAALALSFVTVTAEPASALGGPALCVLDVYNNQAGQPSSGCDGVVCEGFSNDDWETCVGDCTSCVAPAPASTQQAAICVVGDVYNTGSLPCAGLVCYGQTQYYWQNCIGSPPCMPPRCESSLTATTSHEQVAICSIGNAYNTGGTPCEGVVCTGWNQYGWQTCYPELGPCWPVCPPPPPRLLA
jgi:hypothetical protein